MFADAGYQGVMKLPVATGVALHMAMRSSKRRAP